MLTIRQGSSGEDVATWQKIIGVTADGQFGSGTATATKQWQAKYGLAADGIVGPLTWGKATELGLIKGVTASTQQVTTAELVPTENLMKYWDGLPQWAKWTIGASGALGLISFFMKEK